MSTAAYNQGFAAAQDADRVSNPYAYIMQRAEYFEWERGYREGTYGLTLS